MGVENEDAARFQRQPDRFAGSDRFVAVNKGTDVEIADANVRERIFPGHGKRDDAAFDEIGGAVRPSVDGRRRIEALRSNGQVNLPSVGDFFRAGNGDRPIGSANRDFSAVNDAGKLIDDRITEEVGGEFVRRVPVNFEGAGDLL